MTNMLANKADLPDGRVDDLAHERFAILSARVERLRLSSEAARTGPLSVLGRQFPVQLAILDRIGNWM